MEIANFLFKKLGCKKVVFASKRLRNGFTSLDSLGSLLKQNNIERIGVLRQGFGCEFLGKMTFMGSVFFLKIGLGCVMVIYQRIRCSAFFGQRHEEMAQDGPGFPTPPTQDAIVTTGMTLQF